MLGSLERWGVKISYDTMRIACKYLMEIKQRARYTDTDVLRPLSSAKPILTCTSILQTNTRFLWHSCSCSCSCSCIITFFVTQQLKYIYTYKIGKLEEMGSKIEV